jgi:hypothetical protein
MRSRCTTEVEAEVGEVVVEEINGACWETFIFVMLIDNEAEGPVYCHLIGLSPHVNISPGATKAKTGVALGEAELLVVLDAGVGVLTTLMVDDKRERPICLTGATAIKTA